MDIQEKTAQTILQIATPIEIAGTTYKVPQPTIATLILVSQEIAHIPMEELSREKALGKAFQKSVYGKHIARALAIMILGAPNPQKTLWQRLKGIIKSRKKQLKKLTNTLLYTLSIQEVGTIFIQQLGKMQTTDFFMLITFLHEANLLKPTRKVSETTASGQ
ncbi:hypothetical protein RCZ04_04440 [Capnocytophaga sp. HP1101]